MQQHLTKPDLENLIQAEDLAETNVEEILRFFRQDERLQDKLPNGMFAVDPRTGDRVLFNPARARRPHDVGKPEPPISKDREDCPICAGDTTGVIDVAELSEGFTFINKNLFPVLYPFEDEPARGLHLLQWTSNYHHRDWHNLPVPDCIIVMSQLAALEQKWIRDGQMLSSELRSEPYISIIKNAGAEVGASLSHGHQQIAVGNVMPRRIQDHLNFKEHHGQHFSQWMLDRLTPELIIRDFGSAVLAVPHFMKRPYDMLLLMRASDKSYLFELEESELEAAAEGWHLATGLIQEIMPHIDKEPAYNILVHNGPGAGLYFEFKPHTQITGGYEQIGLHICQGSPEVAAADLRATAERLLS